jgi:AcrR family transcriptional regulator
MAGTAIALLTRWLNRLGEPPTDSKTRILDAADEIFVRRGIDGARMQEIADQAGVNKPSCTTTSDQRRTL